MHWSGEDADPLTVGHIRTEGLDPVMRLIVDEINNQIHGQYRHCGQCGTAENWLWASNRENSGVFLFKEATRTGPCSNDRFVWALENRKLGDREYRKIILEANSSLGSRKDFNWCRPPGQGFHQRVFPRLWHSHSRPDYERKTSNIAMALFPPVFREPRRSSLGWQVSIRQQP